MRALPPVGKVLVGDELIWIDRNDPIGLGKGSGRISTPLTTENTAAFAPDPSASSVMATTAKPGRRKMLRTASEKSGNRMPLRRRIPEPVSWWSLRQIRTRRSAAALSVSSFLAKQNRSTGPPVSL